MRQGSFLFQEDRLLRTQHYKGIKGWSNSTTMLSFTISPQVAGTSNMQLHCHEIIQKEIQKVLRTFSHYCHTICGSVPDWLNMCVQLQHFPCEKPQMLTLGCFWNLEHKYAFFYKWISFSLWVTESIKDIFILFYLLIYWQVEIADINKNYSTTDNIWQMKRHVLCLTAFLL